MHAAKLTLTRAKLNARGVVTPIRLYLNADRTKVVPEGRDAAFLLAAAGSEITEADVKRFGIQGLIDEANGANAAEAKAKADAEAKADADAKAKSEAEAKKKAKGA